MTSRKPEETVRKTRVFVVDDHPVVRQGLKLLVDHEPDMEMIGQAESAADALRQIASSIPDVVIADVSLKDSSGIELVKDLHVRFPDLPVLILSMHDESLYAERVLRAGARGYVMKDEATDKVIVALRHILKGELYLSAAMASKMLSKFVEGRSGTGGLPMERLSDRELEVFEFIGQGLGTRQIAERLGLSIKTVEAHRESIKKKLKLPDATALLQHAIHWVQYERPS